MDTYDEMMRLYDVAANKEYKIGELEDTVAELKDALEFEIKCREYLWGKDVEDAPCAHGCKIFCPAPKAIVKKGACLKWCMLREARLAVEAEMDKE